jgi:hypothetical protein
MSSPLSDFWSKLNTYLPPPEEFQFQQWMKGMGKNAGWEQNDYDARGFYRNIKDNRANFVQGITLPLGPNNPVVEYVDRQPLTNWEGHGTDTYKKPSHPTFSDESKYNDGSMFGGHWMEDKNGQGIFQPSLWNIANMGMDNLKNYFNRYEKGKAVLNPMPLLMPYNLNLLRRRNG